MPSRLTPRQVDFFKTDGYLIFEDPVFPQPKFDALKEHFDNKLETWAEDSGGRSPEGMDVPHFADLRLFDWLLDDCVLDIVEPLIGPDIALWSSHFICKPPGVGKRVPWHEDSAYWGKVLDPMEVVTIWLAIDPSTAENGCMRVIPGSHVFGYSDYDPVADPEKQVFGREIKPEQMDETKAVDLVLEPNQCSIHHAKMIHGSNSNKSEMRRCGYTMRYVPASSKFQPEAMRSTHQIYLARGMDRAGNNYGDSAMLNEAHLKQHPQFQRIVERAVARKGS